MNILYVSKTDFQYNFIYLENKFNSLVFLKVKILCARYFRKKKKYLHTTE